MSFEMGSLSAALAAAVGEDAALVEDLRTAFIESAERHIDLLSRARCDANWKLAAYRLHSLAASFGVTTFLLLAKEAEAAAPGDPKVVRRLRAALAAHATPDAQ